MDGKILLKLIPEKEIYKRKGTELPECASVEIMVILQVP
jgi:hypothetical protein